MRVKGQPKILNSGRKLGTPNRTTKEVRRWIHEIVQDNIETLEYDLKQMEPKERWAIIERLLPYIVTKRESRQYFNWEFDNDQDTGT